MATTITPNMNLSVPVVGQEPGPTWATDLNNCMSTIDVHDHSSGKGVQITPSGLNISTDLPYNNNNSIALRSVRFTPQSAVLSNATDIGCLYEVNADLYYNDASGNNIRITQSGAVAGTPGSIANLVSPASASYVSGTGTFVWQSAASTSANLDASSVIFRNQTASSKGITVSAPSALGSNYTITLPALPGSTSLVTLDTSGNLGTTSQITRPQLPTVGQQISSASNFNTSSTGVVDVTNLTVNLTTTGRPVMLFLQGGTITATGSGSCSGTVTFVRGTTTISIGTFGSATTAVIFTPASSYMFLDTPSGATYTYKVQCLVGSSGQTISFSGVTLVAYEL